MIFPEKMQLLRKSKGWTQEDLAERLAVSRQAVAKWETGLAFPDIQNLIQLSACLNVSIDYLVKEPSCRAALNDSETDELAQLIAFRLEAGRNTYAGYMNEVPPTRLASRDYRYEQGDWLYHDTYVGGERFAGQEAVWKAGVPVYAMNYVGRVLDADFSGDFLKEALRAADEESPYRGPACYRAGDDVYKSSVVGDIAWFQGYEEIHCREKKVYECCFHGGLLRP